MTEVKDENKALMFLLLFPPCRLQVKQHFFLGNTLGSLFQVPHQNISRGLILFFFNCEHFLNRDSLKYCLRFFSES